MAAKSVESQANPCQRANGSIEEREAGLRQMRDRLASSLPQTMSCIRLVLDNTVQLHVMVRANEPISFFND